jgi:uncharacterized protein YbaP (TraB family)
MPELVLSGEMINLFTSPDGFRQMIATYNANQRIRREYYQRHREEILAKRRQKYADAHPEPRRKRKASADITE